MPHDAHNPHERDAAAGTSGGPGMGARGRNATKPAAGRREGGGVPDSVLIGGLGLLLGLTVFTWTATGLAGLLTHGSWPRGVTFAHTPMAMRALLTRPHDIAGAWPDADPGHLSGYGLFWGLFISQILVVLVLTVFVLTTVTRARAVRAARAGRRERGAVTDKAAVAGPGGAEPAVEAPAAPTPATAPAAAATVVPTPRDAPPEPDPSTGPDTTPQDTVTSLAKEPTPAPDPHTRVLDADGAALVATTDPGLWAATKDARAKLGPVHLFDPTHLCDTPARLRWSPHHGCADHATATARAAALLAPLRSPRPVDAEVHSTAETLLRCWLHAAALDDRPFREVHRWAHAKSGPAEPVQTLRTHPKAAPGAAGELEAALTAHPERRRSGTELIRSALAPLGQLHVRNACNASRADRIALESFALETGTLYVVGADPAIMPILNALTESVVEHGRRMAARSSPGRLDPPLTTVLDLPTAPVHQER